MLKRYKVVLSDWPSVPRCELRGEFVAASSVQAQGDAELVFEVRHGHRASWWSIAEVGPVVVGCDGCGGFLEPNGFCGWCDAQRVRAENEAAR